MLPRVLEPEVMDSEDEALDYDRMDHSAVNALFVKDFLSEGPLGGPVLDLGTGTAQIPVELCRRDARATCVAVDLAESMLALARTNVAAAGFQGRIDRCQEFEFVAPSTILQWTGATDAGQGTDVEAARLNAISASSSACSTG